MSFRYTVTLTFNDHATAEEWLVWMCNEHAAQVVDAGALSAEIIKIDGELARCEARYSFASRTDFERYVRDHAPRLREEGLRLFSTSRRIQYERSCGEVVARMPLT